MNERLNYDSRPGDFISETNTIIDAGNAVLEELGDSFKVGGPLGTWERATEGSGDLAYGVLKSGENARILDSHKLKVEGLDTTGEHYNLAHSILRAAGKDVVVDDNCPTCKPVN